MKNKRFLLIIAVFILLILMVGALSCKKSGKFKIGESVAAKWSDDNYYLAVIKTANGGMYEVDYADGDKGSVQEADILKIDPNISLATGDKVIAVWTTARFYSGVIEEVKSGSAIVKWDDGSEPSEVMFGKIVKM